MPRFLVAQVLGLVLGVALLRALYPDVGRRADAVAVPHPDLTGAPA